MRARGPAGVRRLAVVAALISGATQAATVAPEPPTAEDYLSVLVNGPWPLEILSYCYSTGDRDPAFQEVGRRWRQRNDGLLATVEEKAASVAIPADIRRRADEASLKAIRRLAARQYDKAAWCRTAAQVIDSGVYDVDRRSDLEAPLKRILGKP